MKIDKDIEKKLKGAGISTVVFLVIWCGVILIFLKMKSLGIIFLVCARHGHDFIGCKSSVHIPERRQGVPFKKSIKRSSFSRTQ